MKMLPKSTMLYLHADHTVEVYVGTDGDHQDEFLRGDRPKDLLRNSIVSPSLLASILNVKYVNSSALHRIEQEFERNGVNISRQQCLTGSLNAPTSILRLFRGTSSKAAGSYQADG